MSWTGKILQTTNPAKILQVDVANINKVMEIEGSVGEMTFTPLVSGDDGFLDENPFFRTGYDYLILGAFSGACKSFIRFPNITIAQGTSVSAVLDLGVYENNQTGDPVSVTVSMNDVDNAVAPTDATEFNNLVLGSSVSWTNISHWDTKFDRHQLDITSIVQSIINRVGWISGNAMQVVIEDNGSGVYCLRLPFAWDYNSNTHAAKLIIS
jgi:hypothetical protein